MTALMLKKYIRYTTALLSTTTIFLFLYFQNSVFLMPVSSTSASDWAACACDSCVADLGNSDWFKERYKPSVPILLNSTNSVLHPNISKWWMELQMQHDTRRYKKAVDTLFYLFPDEEHYSDADPDRCRICAVVGNSGNILGSHYGELIDSHDFVMRINLGPTTGFEKDVGSKTTHRMLYPESAMDLDSSTHLVLMPFKVLDMEWLISAFTTGHITETYMEVPSKIKANKDKVMILHPEFIRYVYDKWLEGHGAYPSSGFLTVMLALHICDKVNVFGFGATSSGIWHHYYDDSMTAFDIIHGGDFENHTLHLLQQEKMISLYNGWT